jgi:hypothetical protein
MKMQKRKKDKNNGEFELKKLESLGTVYIYIYISIV